MKSFQLEIVTPDGTSFSGEAQSLLVRTDDGDIEILAGHADFFATLGIGRARIKLPDGEDRFASASGGFITVASGKVSLAATTFEFADEIDLSRARAAAERAEKALSIAKSERDERVARAKLARALNRIKIAEEK